MQVGPCQIAENAPAAGDQGEAGFGRFVAGERFLAAWQRRPWKDDVPLELGFRWIQ